MIEQTPIERLISFFCDMENMSFRKYFEGRMPFLTILFVRCPSCVEKNLWINNNLTKALDFLLETLYNYCV